MPVDVKIKNSLRRQTHKVIKEEMKLFAGSDVCSRN